MVSMRVGGRRAATTVLVCAALVGMSFAGVNPAGAAVVVVQAVRGGSSLQVHAGSLTGRLLFQLSLIHI